MKITELHEELVAESGVPRSPGLHLSDIIDDFLNTLYPAQQFKDQGEATRQANFEKGFIWEEVLSRAYAARHIARPDEIICDGVACSPDGINLDDPANPILEEYKCTNYSSKRPPDDNLRWILQVKGYCYVVGVNKCIFRVLYLQGDYREHRHTLPKFYTIEFSDIELQENWDMLIKHAKAKGML